MCGITGFWQLNNTSSSLLKKIATKMAAKIVHRGPDDSGVWVDPSIGLALAHRRLSILDLSKAGHQPMISSTGRYVIVFNGEIYNHLEIRKELVDILWNGHSDTETLLAGFEAWGIEETLKKTVGMFAIALWDQKKKILTIARDRMGEKPLYYGCQNDTFMFSSELKAMKAHPDFIGEIDRDVLCLYLRHSYIPAPFSIYKGIKKLPQGTYIQFHIKENKVTSCTAKPIEYWSMFEVMQKGLGDPFLGAESEAVKMLEEQLKKSIKLQMISDVPLGAFLSGGVDSSLIVALMQTQSAKPIKTFSIGFNESSYDEAIYAKLVAAHLGTEHAETYVSWKDAIAVIPKLASMYDEPFADSSQIPTYLVSKIARKHVTVSLSGDAGDELFCGYNRYIMVDKWNSIQKLPFELRRIFGYLIKILPPRMWEKVFQYVTIFKKFPSNMGEKLEKFSGQLINVKNNDSIYYNLVSKILNPERLVLGATEQTSWLTDSGFENTVQDAKAHMMFLDSMTYLPDDIMVKVDRAAMANSLETRVPFLDHRVVELAASMPMGLKLNQGKTKWILRQILYKYVPKKLIERPKAGFAIPVGNWIREDLRNWAESLLNEDRIKNEGFFDAKYIQNIWQEHLSGKRNWTEILWSILMFQEWLQQELK